MVGAGSGFGSGVIVGGVVAGAEAVDEAGSEAKLSGQLGIASAGVSGSSISDDGGQAGMARSVGGSGGQMSVSSGGAGDDADAGGHVDFIASAATALGGSVMAATTGGSSGWSLALSGSRTSTGSPGELGTVAAQSRPGLVAPPLVGGTVLDQSGSPFLCAGAAGLV